MSTKVSSKSAVAAKSTAATKEEAKATPKVIQVPSQVVAEFTAAASADKAASLAIQTRDQGIVKLGTLVGKTMGENDRKDVKEALKPICEAAYLKQGKDALYAGQQLSRILSIAYPGGQNAEPKEAKAAAANVAKAIKENLGTQKVLGMASGRLAFNKAGEVVEVAKGPRGGSNEKTPLETFRKAIEDAFTAFKTSQGEADQMVIATYETMLALELVEDESDFMKLLPTDDNE